MTPETPDPPPVSPDPWKDRLSVAVLGALRSTITAHGSITSGRLGSATKRLIGQIRVFCEAERVRDRRLDWETIQQLANKIAELDAARAADALRHQQEIADISAKAEQQKKNALVAVQEWRNDSDRDLCLIDALQAKLSTAEATIASLTAEVGELTADREGLSDA